MTTVTAEQIQSLIDFMGQNLDLARGRLSHELEGRLKSRRLWEQLTTFLNGLGGCRKSTKQWQKVWADRKYAAKRANAAAHRSATATGGGPATAQPLRGVDLAVVDIMGDHYGLPESSAVVNAFPQHLDTQSTPTIYTPPSQTVSQQSFSILASTQLPAHTTTPLTETGPMETVLSPFQMSPSAALAGIDMPEPEEGPHEQAPLAGSRRNSLVSQRGRRICSRNPYRVRSGVRTQLFELEERKIEELRSLRRSVDLLNSTVLTIVSELRLFRQTE